MPTYIGRRQNDHVVPGRWYTLSLHLIGLLLHVFFSVSFADNQSQYELWHNKREMVLIYFGLMARRQQWSYLEIKGRSDRKSS